MEPIEIGDMKNAYLAQALEMTLQRSLDDERSYLSPIALGHGEEDDWRLEWLVKLRDPNCLPFTQQDQVVNSPSMMMSVMKLRVMMSKSDIDDTVCV